MSDAERRDGRRISRGTGAIPGPTQLTLFEAAPMAPAVTAVVKPIRQRLEKEHERDIERLVPLAQSLAERAGRVGLIMADLRLAAVQGGLLTGEEQGRKLSWLSSVMKRAGLVATGEFRRSHIVRSHGIPQRVWVDPRYVEAGDGK